MRRSQATITPTSSKSSLIKPRLPSTLPGAFQNARSRIKRGICAQLSRQSIPADANADVKRQLRSVEKKKTLQSLSTSESTAILATLFTRVYLAGSLISARAKQNRSPTKRSPNAFYARFEVIQHAEGRRSDTNHVIVMFVVLPLHPLDQSLMLESIIALFSNVSQLSTNVLP